MKQAYNLTFLFLSFLLLNITYSFGQCTVPTNERDALMALYNATDGVNWTNNTNWNTTVPVCDWFGVTVINGNVTILDLRNNLLIGSLPTELENLVNLKDLKLFANQLGSNIPSNLGNLVNLEYLSLYGNQLTGPIPIELGNLINLEELHLQGNQLTGNIPIELGNLTKLRQLRINQNELSGTIPTELGNLLLLERLFLYSNQLTGNIPPSLGNLINLTYLWLQHNQLSGNIPIELGDLSSIERIVLNQNQLTGNIPTQLGNLTSMKVLSLHTNQLSGNIPNSFGNLINLMSLTLRKNELSGTVPSEFENLTKLFSLDLSKNKLSGDFPNLTQISSFLHLSFDNNAFVFRDFENEHPTYTANLTTYDYNPQAKVDQEETINLSEGQSYTLTTSLSSSNNHYQWEKSTDGGITFAPIGIDVNTYSINSATTSDAGVYRFFATNDTITGLTLERNTITIDVGEGICSVPASERDALIALYNASGGNDWANNTNWSTSVPVCDWYGVTVENGHVTKLNLVSNNLIGNISSEIVNLTNLTHLYLNRSNNTNLNRNQLTGSIPTQIGELTNLKVLDLSTNQLTGSIPTQLGDLINLEVLDLALNKLTGSIPTQLGGLINLKHLDLYGGTAVGIESGVRSIYGLLTGSIPTQFENLINLEYLNLEANRFSGEIPPPISNISTLDTLSFSFNKFVFKNFENEHPTYTTNLTSYRYTPQAKVDQEETIFVQVGGNSVPLSTSLSGLYNTYQWQFSSDEGNTFVDIPEANTHDYIVTNATVADQGLYRLIVNNTVVTGLTLERYPITLVVGNSNSFCTSEVEEPSVSNLVPSGPNILWYDSETGGTPINNADEIVIEASDIGGANYWWDDTTDNILTRTISTVYVDTKTPEGNTEQLFSIYASPAPTILDIEVYNNDETVYWYTSDSSTTPLDTNNLLINGETYYASSCDATNNSCGCRLPITITLGIIPPKGNTVQYLCENATLNDIVIPAENNLTIEWYETLCLSFTNIGGVSGSGTSTTYACGTPLDGSTILTDNKTYYAVHKDSNGTKSEEFLSVSVRLSITPPPIVKETTQTFYADESQTVGNLKAFGYNIKWYSQAEGGTAYDNNTSLENGAIYYAGQESRELCSSSTRIAVTVILSEDLANPLLGCELFRPELLEHYVIDAWVNERQVDSHLISEVSFNNSDESKLFVDLLNHLKNRLLSPNKDLHDFPEEYEPEFTGGEPELDFAPLMAYIEGLQTSEKKFIVYDFKAENDLYGRTIGFSFFLNTSRTDGTKFSYLSPEFTYNVPNTPGVGVTQVPKTEHYPLLDNVGSTTDEFLNFTNVEVDESGQFIIYSDFNQTAEPLFSQSAPIFSQNQIQGTLSDLNVIKATSAYYKYTEVEYQANHTYNDAEIEISFVDVDGNIIGTPIIFSPKGEIIDKWQKITGDFVIPNDAGKMTISLKNAGETDGKFVFFDDLRIQPFDSNMKTFVYHPENQRLMSELDENNYATFYEYDSEGGLIRVKKETVKGIYTIQETRSGNIKATN